MRCHLWQLTADWQWPQCRDCQQCLDMSQVSNGLQSFQLSLSHFFILAVTCLMSEYSEYMSLPAPRCHHTQLWLIYNFYINTNTQDHEWVFWVQFKIIKLWRSLRDHKSMFGLTQHWRSNSQSLHTLLDTKYCCCQHESENQLCRFPCLSWRGGGIWEFHLSPAITHT